MYPATKHVRSVLEKRAGLARSAYRATSILIEIVSSNVLVSPATIIGFKQEAFDAFLTRDDNLGMVVYTPSSRVAYATY